MRCLRLSPRRFGPGPIAPCALVDHDIVARRHLVEPATGDLFADADRINVGGVEEIDPGFERDREMLARLVRAKRPVALHRPFRLFPATVSHASETDARYRDARISQLRVLHTLFT